MSSRHQLEQLLLHPRIWKAGRASPHRRLQSSGFPQLDEALGGGWPLGQLVELLVEPCGIGELRLLLPALTALTGAATGGKWVVLIAPPHIPYAPAFARRGLDASYLLVVRCERQADVLWAVEQALHSHACVAVLAWAATGGERIMRRLQLAVEAAAEAGAACLFVLFRPPRCARQRSPAVLRMHALPGAAGAIELRVLKTRGGCPRTVVVDLGGRVVG
jgi:hypothetical protein